MEGGDFGKHLVESAPLGLIVPHGRKVIEFTPAAGKRFGGSFKSGKRVIVGDLLPGNRANFVDALLGLSNASLYVALYLFWYQLRPANVELFCEEGMIRHGQELGIPRADCQRTARGDQSEGVLRPERPPMLRISGGSPAGDQSGGA